MTILAISLFGSRARGDETDSSDVDLLMVTEEEGTKHSNIANVSLSFYQMRDLEERARTGDLFLYHVLFEGRVIYDPEKRMDCLRSTYALRSSYSKEISHAKDLAWMLAHFADHFRSGRKTGRRIAWCVRTIIIARSAEAGRPVFSAHDLAMIAPLPETSRLIALKEASTVGPDSFDDLRRYLAWCEFEDPIPTASSPMDYEARFESSGNTIARAFLRSWRHETSGETYG